MAMGAVATTEVLQRVGGLIQGMSPSGDLGGNWGPGGAVVRAITETSGPSQLVIGNIVDGEHLVRNGLLIESDPGGGPPTGPASGDLSGSFPGPAVSSITDATATQLALGTIADTEVLVRSGATVISEPRVYGLDRVYAESLPVTTSTATAFTPKVALTHPAVGPGTYKINWSYGWNHNSTGNDFLCQVGNGGGIIYMDHVAEPADSGGAGPGGTNQRYYTSGFFDVVYGVPTADTFTMQFATSVAGVSSAIFDARLEFIRVA